jgi:hypothetical protein
MPAPNIANLNADPNGLLPWLDNNLLLGGFLTNVPNPPGLAWVTIAPPAAPLHAVNHAGNPVDVFVLRCNGAGAHNAVRAYICNYTVNGVHSVDLASLADYCFTINLNGCTFGIGPRSPGGVRKVSHANTGGNTNAQRTQTWGEHHVAANSTAISMLEPAEYRRLGGGANLNATVFGIRTGITWQFRYQLWTLSAGNYQLIGVFPIRTP